MTRTSTPNTAQLPPAWQKHLALAYTKYDSPKQSSGISVATGASLVPYRPVLVKDGARQPAWYTRIVPAGPASDASFSAALSSVADSATSAGNAYALLHHPDGSYWSTPIGGMKNPAPGDTPDSPILMAPIAMRGGVATSLGTARTPTIEYEIPEVASQLDAITTADGWYDMRGTGAKDAPLLPYGKATS